MEINSSNYLKDDSSIDKYSKDLSEIIYKKLKKATKKIEDRSLRQRIRSQAILGFLDLYSKEMQSKISDEIEFRLIKKFEKLDDKSQETVSKMVDTYMHYMPNISLKITEVVYPIFSDSDNTKLAFQIGTTIIKKRLNNEDKE